MIMGKMHVHYKKKEGFCFLQRLKSLDTDIFICYSEHSRHWFFRGRLEVDGKEQPVSLFKMIMETQEHSNPNNVIKFSDNSRCSIVDM